MPSQLSLFSSDFDAPPPKPPKIQPPVVTPPRLRPTGEQADIMQRDLSRGNLMLINAGAGTGKTTTLELLSEQHADKRLLYLCYNRALAESAKTRFARHVTVQTSHGMAFPHTGRFFKHKLQNLRALDVRDALGVTDFGKASLILETVNNFCFSPDKEIGTKHAAGSEDDADDMVRSATRLWTMMCDPQSPVSQSHDGYLKLWALQDPSLAQYDIVLLDEAQDANPLLLGLLRGQFERRHCALVLVGDTHQSIYSFRNSTNAMAQCRDIATHQCYLTESFRFPQGVADQANLIISTFKDEAMQLKGRGRGVTECKTFAFLSRTNAGLIARAMDSLREGKKMHFSGTTPKGQWNPWTLYRFGDMVDVLSIMEGRMGEVRSPYLQRFRSFRELPNAANGGEGGVGQDRELLKMIEMAVKFGSSLPDILNEIVESSTGPDDADLSLSSGHRSKGQEWDSVEINDDFLPIYDNDKLHKLKQKLGRVGYLEEANLLYVALTRTRTATRMPLAYTAWFQQRIGMLPQLASSNKPKP